MKEDFFPLLQLCVLGFGLLQDRDVGGGVFPEGEEVFVGRECPDAGSIGIRTLRGSRLQCIGTCHAQMRQRSRPAVPDDAAVIENLLKLCGSSVALSGCQVCLSAYVHRIEAGNVHHEPDLPQLDEGSSLQIIEGGSRVLSVQCQLCSKRRKQVAQLPQLCDLVL